MICVSFATIMSGLVLRWYEDEAGYRAGRELASAGRESAIIEPDASPEICRLADEAHGYLHAAYARSWHPTLDVSRWVTHRAHFASDTLTPVAAPEPESRDA
jgi:hypothetical protein